MNKKIKILCLTRAPLDYFGGIPAYCLNLYKNSGLNITAYSYSIKNTTRQIINRRYGDIKEFVFPSEINYKTFSISIRYFLKILFNSRDFKYIHLQHPDPLSAFSILISKLFNPKIKLLITWHAEIYKSYFLIAPFLFLLDILVFSSATKIIYFTPSHIKDSLLSKFNFFNKKIILIPNCIDVDKLKKYRLPNNVNKKSNGNGKTNIISIGRLVTYKGYEYAIKALVKLDKKFQYNIVGDGPLKKKLEILISKLNLEGKVNLLGEITDKEKFNQLNDADIFLFPSISNSEAYGLVQLEAMCFDLPIINTNLKNGVNYLVPPEIGITCKPKSITEITNSLNMLIEDKKLYNYKVRKIKKHIEKFSLESMVVKYKRIFKS